MDSGKAPCGFIGGFGQPVFSAVIRPHRSLGRKGLRTVMILCGLVMAAAGIPFAVMGLWPVTGFLGLELIALAIAFRASFRSGRSFEEVVLTPIELLFRRVSHRGEPREWRFNPLWTKLAREADEEFGLLRLALVSRGQEVVIARELSPPERESFAEAFGLALARVKRGA
ncbi:MAG TPA: DUF2244 domain-containing protein [Beijerinckiaceae bacterium]|jgi:uncharacterized membrane protein